MPSGNCRCRDRKNRTDRAMVVTTAVFRTLIRDSLGGSTATALAFVKCPTKKRDY
jgi:hypothetical protein